MAPAGLPPAVRKGMRRFLILAGLLVSRSASANQCPALYEHLVTKEVPLGCPVVVYQDHEWSAGIVPQLYVERAGQIVYLTPTVTTESETLSIYREQIDDLCVEHNGYEQRVWDRISFDLGTTVQVGEVVKVISAYSDATITAAGPCPMASPPDEWELYCRDPYQDYQACEQPPEDPVDPMDPVDDTDGDGGYFGGGCNANGGASSVLLVAAVLGLRRRRRVTSRR